VDLDGEGRIISPRRATSRAAGPDSHEPTDEKWTQMKPRARIGRPPPPAAKERVMLRFDHFVLAQYVEQGVDELGQEKLSALLKLRYRALNDAFAGLGKPNEVRKLFVGLQRHLYETRRNA
jgi:uncharacterized protein (DUF4415 family)